MNKELKISRVFNASIENVWKIWVEPDLVMQWWGPDRFICPSAEIDFREGGTSLVCMRAPKEFGGQDFFSLWTYKKIVPMESIEFIQNLADKNGKRQKPVSLGMPADFPEDIRTVVSFKELDKNKTEMTVTEYADFGQTTNHAKLGLEQSLDKAVLIFN